MSRCDNLSHLVRYLRELEADIMHETPDHMLTLSVKMRVVMEILKALGMNLNDIYETKGLHPIDPSVSLFLLRRWRRTTSAPPSSDETSAFENALRSDFVKYGDLVKLSNLLVKKLKPFEMRYAFAMDGLKEDDPKNYFYSLRHPIFWEDAPNPSVHSAWDEAVGYHVRAVRTLYEQNPDVDTRMMKKIVSGALGLKREEEEEEEDDDEYVESLKSLYIDLLGSDNVEYVKQWKKRNEKQTHPKIAQEKKKQYKKRKGTDDAAANTGVTTTTAKDVEKKLKLDLESRVD